MGEESKLCIPFFQVATNGLISVHENITEYVPRRFPTSDIIIAPFWGDVDNRNGAGTISYGVTRDSSLLERAKNLIREAFPDLSIFEPEYIFVATWDSVGYFNMQRDLVHNLVFL